MADQPLRVVRVDSGEAAPKPPLQLASLPWVGPAAAQVETDARAGAVTQNDVPEPPPEPTPGPALWGADRVEEYPAETYGGHAIAGRTYRRVDPPEQMSLASERERRAALESHRRSGSHGRASGDQNPNASVSVALILAAAIGMICWMAYGPGRTKPELLPGDALLLGSSDLAPVAEPEEPAASDDLESEPVLEAPDSPANAIEVEPLSAPVQPTASEPQAQDPVAEIVPPHVAAPLLEPPATAPEPPAPQVVDATEKTPSKPAASSAPRLTKVENVTEQQPAGFARTAYHDIDNRAIDFRRFRPPAAPQPQSEPPKQLGPLFQP